jgi:glycine cleavage system transcriptional repressor
MTAIKISQGIPMKRQIALSAVGRDQPGIVAALSKVFFENQCNLEDSSMTRLAGDFAVLLLISLPENKTAEDLRKAVEPVTQKWGLTYSMRELSAEEEDGTASGLPYTLVVYGVDHPGIVYRIAQAAADEKVNISDLRTHVTSSAQGPLYSLAMEVEIPDARVVELFGKKLESLKKELKVEITLSPVEAEEL